MNKSVLLSSVLLVVLILPSQTKAAAVAVTSGGDTYLVADNGLVSTVGTGVTSGPVDTNTDHYSEPGTFGGQDITGIESWNGDRRWGNDGADTSATYSFTDLVNGEYNVYASWRNVPQGNVSLAHYTVSDGGPTVDIDQRVGATALSALTLNDGTNDVDFALIGSVNVTDGDLLVTVDDSVTGSAENTFIFSDAIAIGPVIPEPSGMVLGILGGISLLGLRRRKN